MDQIVVVLYKKLAPKMYFAFDEHDLDLKLSGPYAQFLCSSESDSALPYNQPFIVTVSDDLAMQNEQFQVIRCQTSQAFSEEEVRKYVSEGLVPLMLYYLCVPASGTVSEIIQEKTAQKVHKVLFEALNANLGQIFTISKLFRCFCGYARGCILTPQFTAETKQRMVDQILDAFAEILGYLFLIEPGSVEEVNPVCGIILTELVTNSSIVNRQ